MKLKHELVDLAGIRVVQLDSVMSPAKPPRANLPGRVVYPIESRS